MMTTMLLTVLSVTIALCQAVQQPPHAVVELIPGSDSSVHGRLSLYAQHDGVYIQGEIRNLAPGAHGFHVHEKPRLGNKCVDAGPHFNPRGFKHAGPNAPERHAGDLGNIYADVYGVANISLLDRHISLRSGHEGFIGDRSFVVHEKADDLGLGGDAESLKTGNAGSRLACGVVVVLGSGAGPFRGSQFNTQHQNNFPSASQGNIRNTASSFVANNRHVNPLHPAAGIRGQHSFNTNRFSGFNSPVGFNPNHNQGVGFAGTSNVQHGLIPVAQRQQPFYTPPFLQNGGGHVLSPAAGGNFRGGVHQQRFLPAPAGGLHSLGSAHHISRVPRGSIIGYQPIMGPFGQFDGASYSVPVLPYF